MYDPGDTYKELIENLYDAVEGCLSVEIDHSKIKPNDTIMELAF